MTESEKRKLFDLFRREQNFYNLHQDITFFIEEIEARAVGETHAKFYGVLAKLSNSINNAGHEERRSADISYIHQQQCEISSKYEEYLS